MRYQSGAAYLPIIALALPLLELVGIYQTWQIVGAWTLAWLLLAAVAGFMLIAAERATFLSRLAETLAQGLHPVTLLKSSGFRFLAGILLIIPGPYSDAVAITLLLVSLFSNNAAKPATTSRRPAANDDIIEGDFRRID